MALIFSKKPQGFSLVEMLLVLVIISALILMTVRHYISYKQDLDITNLRTNVDDLMRAAGRYYQSNCSLPKGPFEVPESGSSIVPVDIERDLLSWLPRAPFPLNPLVDEKDPTTVAGAGYLVQFNPSDAGEVIAEMPNDKKATVGYVTIWQIHVAVALRVPVVEVPGKPETPGGPGTPGGPEGPGTPGGPPGTPPETVPLDPAIVAGAYQKLIGADCVTTDPTQTCAAIPPKSVGENFYLVWERAPMLAAANYSSNLWPMLQGLTSFKQMYEIQPLLLRTGNPALRENYLCGG